MNGVSDSRWRDATVTEFTFFISSSYMNYFAYNELWQILVYEVILLYLLKKTDIL